MVNYLNAELYKVTRRKYPYAVLAVILGLAAFMMLLLRMESRSPSNGVVTVAPQLSVADMLNVLSMVLSMGLYLLVYAADIVFSEQYKHNTLKNEVSYGLPRVRIYLGKLVAAVVTAVALCAALLGGYLLLSFLMFPAGEGLGEALLVLGQALLMALPLWLGGLGLFLMISFFMKSSNAASICYLMLLSVWDGFLELFSEFVPRLKPVLTAIQNCLLITPFRQMSYQPVEELIPYAWVLGICWLAASTVIGIIVFQKREVS